MPNVTETTDAAGDITTTYNLLVGQTARGQITSGDHDFFRINLVAGQQYTFAMVGTGLHPGDLHDTYLRLTNAAGVEVASNDDGGIGTWSTFTFTATVTGVHYLDGHGFNAGDIGQYQISATTGGKALFDAHMAAASMLRPEGAWSAFGTAATVTWAARTTFAGSTDAAGAPAPFTQLTAVQTAAVASMLQTYSQVSNIDFTQVNPGGTSDNATMLFSQYTANDGAGAYAIFPVGPGGDTSAASGQGDVRLNTNSVSGTSLPPGSYSYFAVLHEVGHAVGLHHPGEYNAGVGVTITYAQHAQYVNDSQQYTVMSYFDESNTGANFGATQYAQTLMRDDIYALQLLYGADTTTRTGNNRYGFNTTEVGTVYDFSTNTNPALCIWDAGGAADVLDASGFSQAQRIDLRDGTFSNIGGGTFNVSIAFGAFIETAIGGSGADYIIGNQFNNTLNGRGGIDILQGMGGNDYYFVDNATDQIVDPAGAGYDSLFSSVSYTLLGPQVSVEYMGTTNAAGTGSMNLVGNSVAQTLVGNAGINILVGHGGRDVFRGLGGSDTFSFRSLADSGFTGATRDVVEDFDDIAGIAGDRFDVSQIDAVNGGANNAFTFLLANGAAFTAPGQLRWYTAGGNTFVELNTSGNSGAEFQFQINGLKTLSGADFFL